MKKVLLFILLGAMFFGGFSVTADEGGKVYGPEEYRGQPLIMVNPHPEEYHGQEIKIYKLNPQEYHGQPLTRNFNK